MSHDQPKPAPHLSLGEDGEDLAEATLRDQGWTILERHFRCSLGEVDIIAAKPLDWMPQAQLIIFVEVKTRRRRDSAFPPQDAVHPAKRRRLIRIARLWQQQHHRAPSVTRFDIIAICGDPLADPLVHHFEGAFDAQADIL